MKRQGWCFLISLFLFITTEIQAAPYITPAEFMNLYFDFTGTGEPDFPKNKTTIPQYLIQSEKKHSEANLFNGPLILILNSSIYVYDQNRQLLYSKLLRTNRSTGFYELTAVSHVGPVLSYLAKIKENGDPSWKLAMASLLADIKNVKKLNAQKTNNWLDQRNLASWQSHKKEIQAMIDYAMSMAGNYLVSVQKTGNFSLSLVQDQFLNGNKKYPIPYNSVMVGTFMLAALESIMEVHDAVAKLKLDWPNAMVIVRNVAGNNVSAGLTKETNWMVTFVNALSDNKLPTKRIMLVPYVQVMNEVGQNPLPAEVYQYYVSSVWGSIYNRTRIAGDVFTDLETIYLPDRPAIPGDYGYSSANDITDFMVRLKHSLQDSREMLSNTVGFWLPVELKNKGWDSSKIDIPGLTTGFPAGISGYPTNNPEIAE